MPVAVQMRVAAIVGVDLQLLVAPSVSPQVVNPLRPVRRRSRRAIKLIAPDEPSLLRARCSGQGERQYRQQAPSHVSSIETLISRWPDVRQNAQITISRSMAGPATTAHS